MNDIQTKLSELESNGWTLAAIADELGLTPNAIEKWKAGDRYPANSKAVLVLLDTISRMKRIPKKKRYAPGSRTKLIVAVEKGKEKMESPKDIASQLGTGENIPASQSVPMYVAQKWGFPLQYHEIEGKTYYSIKDWIAGLTNVSGPQATAMWNDFKRRSGDKNGGMVSNQLPYHDANGQVYPVDFTDDEGLYKLAVSLRVTKERPLLKAIKEFLAKSGVFVDEARRNPEAASEKLAIERRNQALQAGKTPEWIATREQSVITRKQFVADIMNLVQDKESFGIIIGSLTNDEYRGVFAADVSGLRARLGISPKENPRDHFSRLALSYTTIAEESIRIFLANHGDHEYVPVPIIQQVVKALSSAVGVQANELAKALQIDIVTGQKLVEAPKTSPAHQLPSAPTTPTQGTLGDILQKTVPPKLVPKKE